MSRSLQTLSFVFMGFLTLSATGAAGSEREEKTGAASVEISGETAAIDDPRATYRAYLDAIRRGDLDAALRFWDYPEAQAAEMRVALGIWTSHRLLDQAVRAKFGPAQDLSSLEGFIDERTTDQALDLTAKFLDAAEIKLEGDIATFQFAPGGNHEGHHPGAEDDHKEHQHGDAAYFDFPEDTTLHKIGGKWKFRAKPSADDFFARGSWGPVFQGMVASLNEAAEKVREDKLKTLPALKEFLDEKQEVITKQYEADQEVTVPSVPQEKHEHEENGD